MGINYLRQAAIKAARRLGHIPAGPFKRYASDKSNPKNVYTHCAKCFQSIVVWADGPGEPIWGGALQRHCKGHP